MAASAEAAARAARVLAALDGGTQFEPFTASDPGFGMAEALDVAACLRERRMARGETPIGRKIGFTNRTIWAEYGVYAPIWGEVYDGTAATIRPGDVIAVSMLPEPRIEPEIVIGLESDLVPGMDIEAVAASIGWIAHGFEIVRSVFPGWRFQAADCIADGGLHGRLFIGPRLTIPKPERAGLVTMLPALTIRLSRDGEVVDTGIGANVLDGPVQALAHLLDVLGRVPGSPPLRAGEIVTTGTLTRAFPVTVGQSWSTEIDGIGLPGLSVKIA